MNRHRFCGKVFNIIQRPSESERVHWSSSIVFNVNNSTLNRNVEYIWPGFRSSVKQFSISRVSLPRKHHAFVVFPLFFSFNITFLLPSQLRSGRGLKALLLRMWDFSLWQPKNVDLNIKKK